VAIGSRSKIILEELTAVVLLTLMGAAAIGMARQRNLFGVVLLSGIYSFLMATVMVVLDAVDVAMTEAAVGAGISTVLLFGAIHLTGGTESKPIHRPWLPLLVVAATGAMLVYGTLGLPAFSDPSAPIHQHVAPRYLTEGPVKTGVPNVVTAVLASYRGFDTLGETFVVFTAGIGVIALLGRRRPRRPLDKPGEEGKE
jgi:multicomponent Na+:H+ antiporter subunit B